MISLPDSIQSKLKACRTLPSIPAVVLEVLDLCQDDDVGIAQVSKVLSRDPALSAKVLKVANSPWYGVRSQITTLERAVTILGINATLSLALSFSLVRGLRGSDKAGLDHQAYWRRCVTTAASSQVIGRWTNAGSYDELFLGGLLQDIGILALNEAIPQDYGRLIAAANGDHLLLAALEKQEFGSDHAEIGAWLLERWNLPANLQLATASSHNAKCAEEDLTDFCRSTTLAGYIAAIWTQPDAAAATALAREKSISLFDMSSSQFKKILDDVARLLPEVTANLDINIGGEEFVDRILEQARATLVELSLQAHRTAHEIQIQAQRDDLTSLANRSYLTEILPQQFLSAQQSGQPLSMLFIDVDSFKLVNDSYGHRGGDQVLISIGQILSQCTRGTDIVTRYGGDEFLILLPGAGDKVAADIAARILAAIQKNPHKIDGNVAVPVTISIGCASMSTSSGFSSADDLIKAADRCLYAAKMRGRNQIVTLDQLIERSAL
ncbi:MAG: GGDEF domain-containing protein [Acidobacteria bacterium]|nr:GGDEF domain-containing protein [Acidobacteriota bacterium]